MDHLESRTLCSTVAWTGAAGDNLWSNPSNWSSNAMPTAQDDVMLDAGSANPTIRFTVDAGVQHIRSFTLSEAMTMTGGLLAVANSARLLSPLTISGGTLEGGSWDATVGQILFVGAATTSILTGAISITGNISISSTSVRVQGSLSLTGTATIGTNGGLDFYGDAPINSGTFVLAGGRLGMGGNLDAPATMTIGPAATVRGWGSVGGALFSQRVVTTLINQGNINADTSGKFLQIAPVGAYASTFTNMGTVRGVNGGLARISAANLTNYTVDSYGTLTGGTWRADANSSLIFDNNCLIEINNATLFLGASATFPAFTNNLRTNNSSITLTSGAIWSRAFPVSNNGTITLESVSNLNLSVGALHSGTFNIATNSLLVITGTATFAPTARIVGTGYFQVSVGTLMLPNVFASNSQINLVIGRNATVTLIDSIHLATISNSGVLNLSHYAAVLGGSYSQVSTATLITDLFDFGVYGQIVAGASIAMAGSIRATNSHGFDPAVDRFYLYTALVLQGASMTGSFATTSDPPLAAGAYKWFPTAHSFELWHNIADFNADGGVDGNDLAAFLPNWEAGNNLADINCDGGTDGNDLAAFFMLWEAGGR